ncbi:hypothetical protein L208DRAFT_1257159 [Tricholoma matsutake]|nr:hypothetical protein L208DRAFT_1257159 [Tricholoma matsutake 945]
MADHERAVEIQVEKRFSWLYLNSAKYLKIGQALWVDQLFSCGVLNEIYDFHASAAAYTAYWNHTFGKNQLVCVQQVTHCQVWQAFVQESIYSIAALSEVDLVLQDGLAIDEVTKEAFAILGANGVIRVAGGHTCSECTHEYKLMANVIPGSDPLATAGFNDRVPQAPVAVGNIQHAQTPPDNRGSSVGDDDMQVDKGVVQLVVLDGIVTGPSCCAYGDCTDALANARGGVFCALHEHEHGAECCVVGCSDSKVAGTQACVQHQAYWTRYKGSSSHQRVSGF